MKRAGSEDDNGKGKLARTKDEPAESSTAAENLSEEEKAGAAGKDDNPFRRFPKRKVCLVIGYLGSDYQGMQRNPGAVTIEDELEKALFKAGVISEANVGTLQKLTWQRAARTDKGVHAVGQYVSCKILLKADFPELIKGINDCLPPCIRIIGMKRVTQGFGAKTSCDGRIYEYILPTYTFRPTRRKGAQSCTPPPSQPSNTPQPTPTPTPTGQTVDSDSDLAKAAEGALPPGAHDAPAATGSGRTATEAVEKVEQVVGQPGSDAIGPGVVAGTANGASAEPRGANGPGRMPEAGSESEFVFSEETRRVLGEVLGRYCGTHKFHNFTSGKEAFDMSSQRYIISFDVSEPFELGGVEYVRCKVVGQSFLLHQIRKMMGLAIVIVRGDAPPEIMEAAFHPDMRFEVPTAPSNGLILNQCLYNWYNKRNYVDEPDNLTFPSCTEAVEAFKRDIVYPHIAARERELKEFVTWTVGLDSWFLSDYEGILASWRSRTGKS